jgi:uncharacterized damage-inducible protein DinB
MPHPLVLQLRFARSEFKRALDGISDADARRRLSPMNSLSWSVGHLAWQEQRNWLSRAQNRLPRPDLNEAFASGGPASTPALDDAWAAWNEITQASDPWLDTLSTEDLEAQRRFVVDGRQVQLTFGTAILRVIYHYWYHTGENMAIRQQLGHAQLPDFVGNIDAEAPYRRE